MSPESSETLAKETSEKAGFPYANGNWITPEGTFLVSNNDQEQHVDTLTRYWRDHNLGMSNRENPLTWMNEQVDGGFIRVLFRQYVLSQVGCKDYSTLWSKETKYAKLMYIMHRLEYCQVHIFSRSFYIVGKAKGIYDQNIDRLQIKERETDASE